MAAFHLKGFERFMALKEAGKASRPSAEAKAKPASSSRALARSGSRRRALAK
ncbi:hypothetical protein [Verrucomicrobium sp. GAS474]|uniref:hypothetical protein n=1 Tax=Verrucomicrobium sp. GAS474 TaxID=1882831 RepID=UPI0012FF77D4|nr:hypothetical protein [Verrucomicrobium sp. GAS474]